MTVKGGTAAREAATRRQILPPQRGRLRRELLGRCHSLYVSVEHPANPRAARSWPRWPGTLLDDLIRLQQHRRRDCQPESLRGLEVDDQLELCGLLDG